ncbi:hypothetical protein [Lysobacter yangpyeongensis]|uniref:hypothetical protein n=1 Tax=Lysobacter yangpyeongensis TaxID=346182 RepID=UPI0036D769F9
MKKAAKKAASKRAARKTPARTAAKSVKKVAKKTAKKAVRKAAKKAPARKAASTAPRKAAGKVAKKAVKTTKATRTTQATKAPRKAAPARRTTASQSGGTAVRNAVQARAVGAAGITPAEKAQRRRAARTDARATIEPADGVTTNFATARSATPRDSDRGTSRTRQPHRITPEEALANTRELLEAKHARDREPPPWRQFDADHGQPASQQATPARDAGQAAEADAHAEELHEAESRLDAIHGSVSEQDRHQQGRRDAGE